MKVVHLFIVTLVFFKCAQSDTNIPDDVYRILPPIFHIDPYEECIQRSDIFCRITLKLTPLQNPPSKVWKLIEETRKCKESYHHDELFHAICVKKNLYLEYKRTSDLAILKNNISQFYSDKYKNQELTSTIVDINCDNYEYKPKFFDIMLLFFLIFYVTIIILATFNETKNCRKRTNIILIFSLRYNLEKLRKIYRKIDSEKLKCIQAVRFYTTVLIIFCHTFCSYAGGYIANTKYFEDIHRNVFRQSIRILFVFLVQTFFLLSGWLLSYHTFKIFQKSDSINVYKYVFLTFWNRYLRILPPVLLMVFLDTSIWLFLFFDGPVKHIYSHREYERCQKNWWIHLLFITNHYRQQDMCYFTLWYLSADTQLYILSLICLITVIKLKKKKFYVMLISLVIGIAIPSTIAYLYDLDIIFKITPEKSKNNMFFTFELNASYTSTYSNMATYMLGLIFGYIYFHFERVNLFNNRGFSTVWWTLTCSLPLIVITVSFYEYNKLTSAILAGILKPIYALGIGMALFGMSQKQGGLLRVLCEWKPIVFLGNFTYSTYVVHFGIVFYRTVTTLEPLQVSDFVLLTSFLQDTILSFICGFIVHLMLEMPMSQLQRMFVPKYSAKCTNSKQT